MQLSVLSALVHADHADRDKALEAFVSALNFIDGDRGSRYYDFVIGALPEQARRQLEEMMSTTTVNPFKSEFARRYFEQGRAQAVLMILDARGIAISDENRARIGETVDHAQLDAWIERAATIEHGEDL